MIKEKESTELYVKAFTTLDSIFETSNSLIITNKNSLIIRDDSGGFEKNKSIR